MGDWGDAARGHLAGLVALDRFAARGMIEGTRLEVVLAVHMCIIEAKSID